MSASQRDKGARGEREFCKLLLDEFGFAARRNLGQARDAGNDVHAGPFHFEVKRRASMKQLEGWMDQAQSSGNDLYAVAMRPDNGEWMVLLPWEVFAQLAREEFAAYGEIGDLPTERDREAVDDDGGEGDW